MTRVDVLGVALAWPRSREPTHARGRRLGTGCSLWRVAATCAERAVQRKAPPGRVRAVDSVAAPSMTEPTVDAAAGGGAAGDAGFDAWAAERGRSLLIFATAVTGDREAARDAVQDALVAVYLRWRRLIVGGEPDAYARRVIVNRHISLVAAARPAGAADRVRRRSCCGDRAGPGRAGRHRPGPAAAGRPARAAAGRGGAAVLRRPGLRRDRDGSWTAPRAPPARTCTGPWSGCGPS